VAAAPFSLASQKNNLLAGLTQQSTNPDEKIKVIIDRNGTKVDLGKSRYAIENVDLSGCDLSPIVKLGG
jgi:hypothetical protein